MRLGENIVHMVLAKVAGGAPGVKGIGLFIVPRFLVGQGGEVGDRNDIVLAGLNHKMGFRGTVNTVLGFGEGAHRPGGTAGAVGYLVGTEDRGLAYMFHMMNESRIAVGLGATAIGYAGYTEGLAVRARPDPGASGRAQRPDVAGGADHPARRRETNAARAEGVRRGRSGAMPLLLAPSSTRDRTSPEPDRAGTCCAPARGPHADRQEPGHRSGAWRRTTWRSRSTAATATPATT